MDIVKRPLNRNEDIMLSEENIRSKMKTARCGSNVVHLYETGSTNDYAKSIAHEAQDGTLVVADCQVSGKGRLGRSWNSPHGIGIFMSLILKDGLKADKAPMITIVAAMAVMKALDRQCDNSTDVSIKWPNDIVINGKKVCGILTEMKTVGDSSQYVVVGIGINVNNESFADDISRVATSMYIEEGKRFDRSDIVCDVMEEFEKYYGMFLENENLSSIKEEYNSRLVNMNNEVEIIRQDGNYRAQSLGMDEDGGLIVRRQDGSLETVVSGEVSVRGVYGYV